MGKMKLGNILENAVRLTGRQVGSLGVTENQRALAAMAMSEGIRKIAAEKLPMMQRIEYRRFRPTWTSNAGWMVGQECFYSDDYWRLTEVGPTAAPRTDPKWMRLHPEQVVAFVSFEQPWENTVIDRAGIDVNRFAYESDPRYNPQATPIGNCVLTDLGITIHPSKAKGIWCRFVPKYPNVSFIEWSSTNAYEAGDVVYLTSTKDCYQAIRNVAAGGTSPATDYNNWDPIRISADFETYLTRLVAADLMTEDQGKYQTKAAAEKEFEDVCSRFIENVGYGRIRTGRFR